MTADLPDRAADREREVLIDVIRRAIRDGLTREHLSQKQMAMALGLSEKHVSQILTGRADGSLDTLDRMLRLVGAEPAALAARPAPNDGDARCWDDEPGCDCYHRSLVPSSPDDKEGQ